MEHSSQANIDREPIGLSPKSKKVVHEEEGDHLERSYATDEIHSVLQESIKGIKTQSKETLSEKSLKGPGCQETMGEGDASAVTRQNSYLVILALSIG